VALATRAGARRAATATGGTATGTRATGPGPPPAPRVLPGPAARSRQYGVWPKWSYVSLCQRSSPMLGHWLASKPRALRICCSVARIV
jgi:hypothetical protein